jgi:hypothetical protein
MQKSSRQSSYGNSITALASVALAYPLFSQDGENHLAARPFGIGLMRSCLWAECKDRASIYLLFGHPKMG